MEPDQIIQPSPVPVSMSIGTVAAPDGTKLVFMQSMSPTGSHVVFIPPDFAFQVAQQVKDAAIEAKKPALAIARVMPDGPTSPVNGHK